MSKQQSSKLPISFVDLNMPGMSGHELIQEIRSDPSLRQAVVFVLSSSDHNRDIQMAYEGNVAGYFVKTEIQQVLDFLSQFIKTARLPYLVA